MKLETTKLELSEAANPKLPHLLWWTLLVNTRRRTPPCSPGRSEIDYLLKESVVKKMFLACPASIGKYRTKNSCFIKFCQIKRVTYLSTQWIIVLQVILSLWRVLGNFFPTTSLIVTIYLVSADVPTCSDVTLDTNNVTQSSFYSLNGFINSTPICYEGGCWCKHIQFLSHS